MRRPFVIVCSAITLDGKLACADRLQLQLSNREDRGEVDLLRAGVDAILVGSTTVTNDDPSLTIKIEDHRNLRAGNGLPPDPIKVAISKYGDILPESDFITRGDSEKIIFVAKHASPERIDKLQGLATVIQCGFERVEIGEILTSLYSRGVRRLMVEGGGETNASFINAGVVDEIRLAIAPVALGGRNAPTFMDGPDTCVLKDFVLIEYRELGGMVILRYVSADGQNKRSRPQ